MLDGTRIMMLLGIYAVCVAMILWATEAKAISIDEYDRICPAVDFSPSPPVCRRFRVRRTCTAPNLDFSPPRPGVCVRTICPAIDFSPQPPECVEDNNEADVLNHPSRDSVFRHGVR